jgi:solute carrier family 35 protein
MTTGLNTWGLELYNNLEAFLPFPLELLIMGELKKLKQDSSHESDWYSLGVLLPVGLSCLFGLSISFFGFSLQVQSERRGPLPRSCEVVCSNTGN